MKNPQCNSNEVRVGHFTCRDGLISGPDEYMADRGSELIAKIGNIPGTGYPANIPKNVYGIKALLARFQIDFTDWLIEKLLKENLLSPENAKACAAIFIEVDPKFKN